MLLNPLSKPIISIQQVERVLLGILTFFSTFIINNIQGRPFSECKWGREMPESGNICLQNILFDYVSKTCNCIPDLIQEAIYSQNYSSCNYFQHAFCASSIIEDFHWSATEQCEPRCIRELIIVFFMPHGNAG